MNEYRLPEGWDIVVVAEPVEVPRASLEHDDGRSRRLPFPFTQQDIDQALESDGDAS